MYMKNFRMSGQSICISNGIITINGKTVNTGDEKEIHIVIEGNCDSIDVDYCQSIEVQGSVSNGIKTISGDVKCAGDISGSVNTMSGDVRASKIGGSVSTMSGDIN